MTISSFEQEEYLVFSGFTGDGKTIDQETMEEIMKLSATKKASSISKPEEDTLKTIADKNIADTKLYSENRNMEFLKEETEKIDRYTDDKLYAVEKDLKDVKAKIKALTREERQAEDMSEKLKIQEEIASLEKKKRRLRQNIFDVEDEIDLERKNLILSLKKRLKSDIEVNELFKFRWKLV